MHATTLIPPGVRRHERVVRFGLLAFGATWLATAAFQVADPAAFVDRIGPFGEANGHYVRDLATWYAAAGAALLVAVGRAGWRVPVLALCTLQSALHLLNHLVDAGEADPSWMGVVNAVLLAAGLGLFAWLLVLAREAER